MQNTLYTGEKIVNKYALLGEDCFEIKSQQIPSVKEHSHGKRNDIIDFIFNLYINTPQSSELLPITP